MKLLQTLRALLAPALCERCGESWTPPQTANATAPAHACPGCAYTAPARSHGRPS